MQYHPLYHSAPCNRANIDGGVAIGKVKTDMLITLCCWQIGWNNTGQTEYIAAGANSEIGNGINSSCIASAGMGALPSKHITAPSTG